MQPIYIFPLATRVTHSVFDVQNRTRQYFCMHAKMSGWFFKVQVWGQFDEASRGPFFILFNNFIIRQINWATVKVSCFNKWWLIYNSIMIHNLDQIWSLFEVIFSDNPSQCSWQQFLVLMRRTTDEGELIDFSPNFKNQTPGNVPGIAINAASFHFLGPCASSDKDFLISF